MHKWIIILPILIIFISGCTNIDIESLLKADPTVDSYLNDYPDAELNIKRFDAASIDEFVDQIRNSCDNQAIATQEMYRVLLVSENKDDYVMIWATNTGDFVCVIRTAEQSPGPSDDPDFVCEAGDTILCGSSIGECQEGIRICKDNVWGSCIYSIEPETEVCDELDNDCDGEVNEDDVCTVNGCTEGEIQECGIDTLPCKKGNQTCVDDQWGTCEGSIDPEAETCDDIDNNCDGNIDEGGVCGASCETEWFCVSSTSGSYEAYRMENCSIINNNACEFGCEENRCGAAPLIDTNYIDYDYRGSMDFSERPFNSISPGRFQILRTGQTHKIMYRPERWRSDPFMDPDNTDYYSLYDYYTFYLSGVGLIGSTDENEVYYSWRIPEELNGQKLGGYNYRILVYAEGTDILHAKSYPFDIIPAGDVMPTSTRFKIGDRIEYYLESGQDPKMAQFGSGTIVGGPKLNENENYWMWNISFDSSPGTSSWKGEGALDFLYRGYDTEPLTEDNWNYADSVFLDKDVRLQNTEGSGTILAKTGQKASLLDMKIVNDELWFKIKYNYYDRGEGWVKADILRKLVGDSSRIIYTLLEYQEELQKGSSQWISFRVGITGVAYNSPVAWIDWGDGTELEWKSCSNYLKLARDCALVHQYTKTGTYTIKLAISDRYNGRVEDTLIVNVVGESDKFKVGDRVKTTSYVKTKSVPKEGNAYNRGVYEVGSTGKITKNAIQSGIVFDSSGNVDEGKGFNWYWYVDFDGNGVENSDYDGWVDEDNLAKINEVVNAKFEIGQRVFTTTSVSVYSSTIEPWFSMANNVIDTKVAGSEGTIRSYYDGPEGKFWKLDFPYPHEDGWIAEEFLEAA